MSNLCYLKHNRTHIKPSKKGVSTLLCLSPVPTFKCLQPLPLLPPPRQALPLSLAALLPGPGKISQQCSRTKKFRRQRNVLSWSYEYYRLVQKNKKQANVDLYILYKNMSTIKISLYPIVLAVNYVYCLSVYLYQFVTVICHQILWHCAHFLSPGFELSGLKLGHLATCAWLPP